MALNGTFYTNVDAHWRLQLEWSATQDVGNNTSRITAKLYWMGLDSYGTTYTSSKKDGSVSIDGTASAFSGAGLAKLTGAEKKLIKTFSKTVTHDSEGRKSVPLSAYFDVELSLNGRTYHRVKVSGTAVLNSIPRSSSLTSSPSWIAGDALPITISRATTTFLHDITIKLNGTIIKEISNVATSTTVNFTVAEMTNIFTELAKDTVNYNQVTTIDITTKSGSSIIGSKSYSGVCSSPRASTLSSEFNHYVYVDQAIEFPLSRENVDFTHTVDVEFGTFKKTITGLDTFASWLPDANEQSNIYAQMPDSPYKSGTVYVTTYYNGVKVRSTDSTFIQFYVRNSLPVFNENQVGYADVNTVTKAITGNPSYIIQGQSNISVSINSAATGLNGASISKYEITLGGETKYLTSIGSVTFGITYANVNIPIIVKAVDSRGFSTTVSKTISVLPYSPPRIESEAKRLNNFENQTTVKLKGSYSLLSIAGVNKNTIATAQYRYREKLGVWGAWQNFAYTSTGANYTATDVVLNLDNQKSFEIEIKLTDNITGVSVVKTVDVGLPILFIDSKKKSVGVGKFPKNQNSFEVGGSVHAKDLTIDDGLSPTTFKNLASSIIFENPTGNVEFLITSTYVDVKTNKDKFYMTKPVNFEKGLSVSGDANLYNNLYVSGNATINGNFNISNLSVTNAIDAPAFKLGSDGQLKQSNTGFINARTSNDLGYAKLGADEVYLDTGFQGNAKVTNKGTNAMSWYGFGGSGWAIVQRKEVIIDTGGLSQNYVDFTWDRPFGSECQAVQSTTVDSNSVSYNTSVYSVTRTGARAFVSHIHKASNNLNIKVHVLGIGD